MARTSPALSRTAKNQVLSSCQRRTGRPVPPTLDLFTASIFSPSLPTGAVHSWRSGVGARLSFVGFFSPRRLRGDFSREQRHHLGAHCRKIAGKVFARNQRRRLRLSRL